MLACYHAILFIATVNISFFSLDRKKVCCASIGKTTKDFNMIGTKGWFSSSDTPLQKQAKVGAPTQWTEERINNVILDLIEWAEKDDSICLAGFRADYYLSKRQMQVLRDKSPLFACSYELAQLKVAERLAKMTGKTVHQAVFNKYQTAYDSELMAHEIEMSHALAQKKQEELRTADQIARRYGEIISGESEKVTNNL